MGFLATFKLWPILRVKGRKLDKLIRIVIRNLTIIYTSSVSYTFSRVVISLTPSSDKIKFILIFFLPYILFLRFVPFEVFVLSIEALTRYCFYLRAP